MAPSVICILSISIISKEADQPSAEGAATTGSWQSNHDGGRYFFVRELNIVKIQIRIHTTRLTCSLYFWGEHEASTASQTHHNVFFFFFFFKSVHTNQSDLRKSTERKKKQSVLTVGSRVCSKVSFLWSSSWWWGAVDTRCTANTPRAMTSRWPSSRSGRRWDAGILHTRMDDDSQSLE